MKDHATAQDAGFAYDWSDAFALQGRLSEDERLIRDAARDYAEEHLLTRVTGAYLEERVEPEIFREMGERGLLGVTVPEEYGGAGAG